MIYPTLAVAVNLAISVEDYWGSGYYQIALDTILVSFAIYIFLRKPDKPEKPLTTHEIEQLIGEWEPEPMFVPLDDRTKALSKKVPTITGSTSTHVTVNGKDVLALARTNFTGMVGNKRIEEVALKTVYKYGTGSCGPRGFYGTIDVHLDLEQRIKKFLGAEDCLMYSYGFATVSSTIPAFSARGDLLVVDKGVNYSIQTGVKLSRSEVIWFEHNDMEDLERALQKVQKDDKRNSRPINRRFIIVEGLYHNYGDFVPLDKVMKLKEKYCWRIILDDSYGMCTTGKTGRGTCEVFGISVKDVDFLCGSLESSVGSVGGFCCGKPNIIYHQRLNASGYVYSASLPPLLASAGQTALDIIDEDPSLISDLAAKTKIFVEELASVKGMTVTSDKKSPVVHLRLVNPPLVRIEEDEILQKIVDKALEGGVMITRAQYISDQEKFAPSPSIRLYVTVAHSENQIKQAVEVIKKAASDVL